MQGRSTSIIVYHALRVIYSYVTQTVVVTQNQVTCRLEEYFPCPNKFLPERWMKGSTEYRVCSPYLVLPFGHGPRSCIARRLAEQALQVLIIRVRASILLKIIIFLFFFYLSLFTLPRSNAHHHSEIIDSVIIKQIQILKIKTKVMLNWLSYYYLYFLD